MVMEVLGYILTVITVILIPVYLFVYWKEKRKGNFTYTSNLGLMSVIAVIVYIIVSVIYFK